MKIKYLTYNQAMVMCIDHQYLIGKPFEKASNEREIKQVLIAPYSRILQWQFVRSINNGVLPEHALIIPGIERYDVILMPDKHASDGTFLFKDLRSFCEENDLTINMPKYHAIK